VLCSVKEGFHNETVTELSSASHMLCFVLDLLFPLVCHFFGVALIINWEIEDFVITYGAVHCCGV